MQFYEKGIAPHGLPLTQQQAVDILDVYDTLLGVQTDVQALLSRHLPHVHPLDAQQHQPFLALRMRSLFSLQRLLIACSESREDICLLCFRVVIQDGLLKQLLQALAESPHEPLRQGVGEMPFIFLVRIPDGPTRATVPAVEEELKEEEPPTRPRPPLQEATRKTPSRRWRPPLAPSRLPLQQRLFISFKSSSQRSPQVGW
ncbi:hypothetical protein LSM04_002922 [Trypanosoma melophagium]|uniref:uncharacterized protein n=1 Tax=Trypanosoma melophagium TaxID=715481 RepID=UPI00351A5F54|nr:hypothetical protein LSM04_002922 [Trypanosoma melophagium]